MAVDYNEILLQAVDTVVKAQLNGLSFDKTIKCEIVDNTYKTEGIYTVTDGAVKMEAFSDKADKYEIGDKVYVTVPQGDYKQNKIIVSKIIDDVNKPIAYVSPLSTVMDISGNLATSTASGIVANGNEKIIKICSINLRDGIANISPMETTLYDTIGFSANFRTLLGDKPISKGNYGIRFDLFEYLNVDGEETFNNINTIYFDSSEMFGNPYDFLLPMRQEIKIDKGNKMIWGMNIYLYQNGNFKFLNDDGSWENYPSTFETKSLQEDNKITTQNKSNNILVSDLNICIGANLELLKDDTFSIYTKDREEYTKENNAKNIYLKWVNKNPETHEFIGFSDGIVDTEYSEDNYLTELENNWRGISVALPTKNYLGVVGSLPTNAMDNDVVTYNGKEYVYSAAAGQWRLRDDTEVFDDEIPNTKWSYQAYATARLITPEANKLKNYIDIDVNSIANSLKLQLNMFYNEDSIPELADNISKAIEEFNKYYTLSGYEKKCNDYLKEIKNGNNPSSLEYTRIAITGIKTVLYECDRSVEGYAMYDIVKDNPDFVGYADYLYSRIKKTLNNIETSITVISAYMSQTEAAASKVNREDDGEIVEAYNNFKDNNSNKYCIYWYKYNVDAVNTGDRYYPQYWERIVELNNVGLPSIEDGKYLKLSDRPVEIACNVEQEKERIKAILFFNHQRYESELILTNVSETESNKDGDINGALWIEVGMEGSNSMEVHQIYSSYYTLMRASDRYINRKIKVRFEGVEGGDEVLRGSQIFWYVPTQATTLTYDATKLKNAGFSYLDITKDNGNHQLYNIEYYLPGYDCFYKLIPDDNSYEDDTYFWYQVQNVLNPTSSNNAIICKMVKNDFVYEASKLFSFTTYGNNGTDYTLSIVPVHNQSAVMPTLEEYYKDDVPTTENSDNWGPLELKAVFTDYNGVPLNRDVNWYWLGDSATANQNEITKSGIIVASTSSQTIDATTKADQTLQLTAIYPVPRARGPYYIDGPSVIIYDATGANPQYYNAPYRIFYRTTGEEIENVVWSLSISDEDAPYGPKLVSGKLIPSAMYTSPSYRPIITKNGDETTNQTRISYPTVTCYKDGKILYSQPIYIGQNRYGSPMLNKWDEKLQIDEQGNTILTAMVGAGYKDENNAFHGIVMGDVTTKLGDEAVTATGLYGYHAGAQSFAWKVDGTGFIGKQGQGRIEFDGNVGAIKSPTWTYDKEKDDEGNETGEIEWQLDENTSHGSLIDFTQGQIAMQSQQGNYLQYNLNNDGQLKLKLTGANLIFGAPPAEEGQEQGQDQSFNDVTDGLKLSLYRNASYYGTSDTVASIANKVVELIGVPENKSFKDDILHNGLIIAVTFTDAEELTTTEEKSDDGDITGYTRTGRSLTLTVEDSDSYPIVYNGVATSEENYFSWSAGSTIYFIYNNNNWVVTDSGSYSTLILEADRLQNTISNNTGTLSTKITQTEELVMTEAVRKASYYGTGVLISSTTEENPEDEIESQEEGEEEVTSSTTGHTYEVNLVMPDNLSADQIQANIFKEGIVISVSFADEEVANVTYEDKPENADENWKGKIISRTGRNLYLSIKNCSSVGAKPVYYNGSLVDASNPFEWSAGSIVNFVYNNQGWVVSDAGSYSRNIQNADENYNLIVTESANNLSYTKERADRIESEVRAHAGYYGTCSNTTYSTEGATAQTVEIKNAPTPEVLAMSDLLQEGVQIGVTFEKAGNIGNTKLVLQNNKKKADQSIDQTDAISLTAEDVDFSWEDNSTVYFVYTGSVLKVTDSGNYARVTKTANAIVSEVKRTATYYGVCSTDNGAPTKEITLTNLATQSEFNVKQNDVFKTGVTIKVKFTDAEDGITETTSDDGESTNTTYDYLSLQIINDGFTATNYPIHLKGEAVGGSKEQRYHWSAGSIIYFTFNEEGYWDVSDSGAYSNITQTADSILMQVQNTANNLQLNIDAAEGKISALAQRTINYYCTENTRSGNIFTLDGGPTFADTNNSPKQGDVFSIKFTTAQSTQGASVTFKFSNDSTETVYNVSGNAVWNAGETVGFVFDGTSFIVTSLSNAQLTITKNEITASVSTKYGTAMICDSYDFGSYNLISLDTDFKSTDLKTGVTIAVTFGLDHSEDYEDKFYFDSNTYDVVNLVPWKSGETLFFMFIDSNGGYFRPTSQYTDAQFQVLSDNISAQVKGKADAHGGTGNSGFGWSLDEDGFYLQTINANGTIKDTVLSCNSSGIVVNGEINATSGEIAGWTITSTSLKSGTEGESGFIGLWTSYPNSSNYRLRIGSNFSVDRDGNLTCTGGSFSGSIGSSSSASPNAWFTKATIGELTTSKISTSETLTLPTAGKIKVGTKILSTYIGDAIGTGITNTVDKAYVKGLGKQQTIYVKAYYQTGNNTYQEYSSPQPITTFYFS